MPRWRTWGFKYVGVQDRTLKVVPCWGGGYLGAGALALRERGGSIATLYHHLHDFSIMFPTIYTTFNCSFNP